MVRWQYMAVYSRGKQEKNGRKKGTTEKTKARVRAIDVTMQRQRVSNAVSHSRCTQQRNRAYIGQDIIEPPFLLGDERIGGVGEPIEHQQHLDGLLPQGDRSQPKDAGEKRNNKGQQKRAITGK
jgi:hypothetical protein